MTAAELLEQLRDELGGEVLGLLGYGLGVAEGPLAHLGQAFVYASQDADDGDRLTELATRFALRRIRLFGGEDLLAKLEEVDGPPWTLVHRAVSAVDVETAA